MARSEHSKKEVEAALRHAEENNWRVEESKGKGHAWGQMYCPYKDDECRCGTFCRASIWSTPKNPGDHAKHIRKVVDNCSTHKKRLDAASDDSSEKE
jgi:hypothetical protein